jgi:hypothetical protein
MRGEDEPRAVRSGSDGSVTVQPAEAWAGHGSGSAWPASAAPAWPASAAPARSSIFFSKSTFPFSTNGCKIKKLVENVLGIQKL